MEPIKITCQHCEKEHDESYSQVEADDSSYDDPLCGYCRRGVSSERDLAIHEMCQRIFHVSCVDEWSLKVRKQDPTIELLCPVCQEHVSDSQPFADTIHFSAATEHTLQALDALLHTGIRVYHQDITHVGFKAQTIQTREGNSFPLELAEQIFGCDSHEPACLCSFRTYDIEDNSSVGSALWQKTTTIHGGAFRVEHCDHNIEYILMTAKQMHQALPHLWLQGWDPASGMLRPRVIAEKGTTLNQLIEQAMRLNVPQVIIPCVQIAYLFPKFSAFEDGTLLTVVVMRGVTENGNPQYWIEAVAFLREMGQFAHYRNMHVVQPWTETFQMIYRLDPNFRHIVSPGQDSQWLKSVARSQMVAYGKLLLRLDAKNPKHQAVLSNPQA